MKLAIALLLALFAVIAGALLRQYAIKDICKENDE